MTHVVCLLADSQAKHNHCCSADTADSHSTLSQLLSTSHAGHRPTGKAKGFTEEGQVNNTTWGRTFSKTQQIHNCVAGENTSLLLQGYCTPPRR